MRILTYRGVVLGETRSIQSVLSSRWSERLVGRASCRISSPVLRPQLPGDRAVFRRGGSASFPDCCTRAGSWVGRYVGIIPAVLVTRKVGELKPGARSIGIRMWGTASLARAGVTGVVATPGLSWWSLRPQGVG